MAGLKIRVMKTVSEGTKKIIMRRARMEGLDILFHENAALALCNGNVCDLIYASDLAQKASDVEVFEIKVHSESSSLLHLQQLPYPKLPGRSDAADSFH